jgi:hypothetical protein
METFKPQLTSRWKCSSKAIKKLDMAVFAMYVVFKEDQHRDVLNGVIF